MKEKIYWKVGDRTTYSKLQAMAWANGDVSRIDFFYMDKEWGDRNWSRPPQKSLETLTRERCEYLRSKTEHLCLWLSSGYDSVTILNKFSQHQIPLDEIVIYKRWENDPESDYSLPIAKNYKKYVNSNVTITFIPLDYRYAENSFKQDISRAVEMDGSLRIWIIRPALRMLAEDPDFVRKFLRNANHDRIDITGWEKPRLTLEDGKWYVLFVDDSAGDQIHTPLKGFWCDDDCWELFHAACWSTMLWMESLPELTKSLVHVIQSHDMAYYMRWNLSCGRDLVINDYSTHGQSKLWFQPNIMSPNARDYMQHFRSSNSVLFGRYLERLKTIQDLIGKDKWSDFSHNFPLSLATVVSQRHYLKDLGTKRLDDALIIGDENIHTALRQT